MRLNFSRKKVFGVTGVIFLLLIAIWAVDFYLYLKKQPTPEEKMVLDCEDIGGKAFIVNERDGKKIVSSRKDGIRFEIPGDWKMIEQDNEKELDFLGSGAKTSNPVSDAKMGVCGIATQLILCNKVNEFSTYADQVRIEISLVKGKKTGKDNESQPKKEIFKVGNKEGIKDIYERDGKVKNLRVWIPVGSSVYVFDSGIIFNNECVDKFNEIVKTISIL